VIGKRCTIKPGVYVWNGVTIGDDVFVGPNVTFTNDRRPRVGRACPVETTRVESGASIGAGAVILSGVVIGAGAMVGAGAVVTYSVPSGVTVVGNPAEARHAVVETVDERCSQAYGFTVDGRPFAHVSHCGCGAHKVAR
jgi:acetyltransferase-like isoleucine patch superfamily enzyme